MVCRELFFLILKPEINILPQLSQTPTKISNGIFNTLMDFARASLQENCLLIIFTVSHFAGSNQWLALPELLCTARLHQVMHVVGPKVEFVVLKSMLR